MNSSILLVESQVILNRIMDFKSKNIFKCSVQDENAQGAVHIMRWRVCVSKSLVQIYPQTGNTVPYYLFDYDNTENINQKYYFGHVGCLVV